MKKQLMICLTACAFLSACATTRAAREAMTRAQQDVQNAESSLAAAKNAGAETYAPVNISSARMVLQAAKSELGNKQYDKASFSAQSSLEFSGNAIRETEIARKREAEAKRRQAEEARQKAVLEEQAKAKAAAAPKKAKPAAGGKPAVKSTIARPAAEPKAVPQAPPAPQKEEPKKKSWLPW